MRRSVHTSGRVGGLALGLLAVVLFSSCSSPSSPGRDVVASANGVELTRTELAKLMATPAPTDNPTTTAVTPGTAGQGPSADETRGVISNWMQVAAIGGDMGAITSRELLKNEAVAIGVELATPFLGPAADEYAKGFGGSPTVCLGAIPLAPETDPNEVIDAMTGGMSLAEAAATYSSDPAFVRSGGVLTFQDNTTCTDPANLNPDIVTQMDGAKPGEPTLIAAGDGQVILIVRPFDTLKPTEQIGLDADVQTQVAKELNKRLQGADMFVDKRYGRWDPETSSVVPLVVE